MVGIASDYFTNYPKSICIWNYTGQRHACTFAAIQIRGISHDPTDKKMSDWTHGKSHRKQRVKFFLPPNSQITAAAAAMQGLAGIA